MYPPGMQGPANNQSRGSGQQYRSSDYQWQHPQHASQAPPPAKKVLPPMTKDTMLSVVWLILSLFVVFLGGLHMHIQAYRFELSCDTNKCTYKSSHKPAVDFLRSELLGSSVVAANKDINSKEVTLKIRYNSPAGSRFKVEKHFLFTPHGLGEQRSSSFNDATNHYVTKVTDKLNIISNQNFTLLGMICIVTGLGSTIMSVLQGSWKSHANRIKKAY